MRGLVDGDSRRVRSALAAIRLGKLENGKLAEFALEGLDARAPQGPVKVGRFALKSLDMANLMRVSAQFVDRRAAIPPRISSPRCCCCSKAPRSANLVAPYKNTGQPVSIDTLNLVVGPVRRTDPDARAHHAENVRPGGPAPIRTRSRLLAAAGMTSATINFDLGAAWTEGTKRLRARADDARNRQRAHRGARASLGNVPREMFSINPLQAAIMAAQIEAGPLEIALRDTGGVDLAVAQYARTQNVSREAARSARSSQNIRENGDEDGGGQSGRDGDRGRGRALHRDCRAARSPSSSRRAARSPVMQLIETLKANPMAALARFQVDAGNGR